MPLGEEVLPGVEKDGKERVEKKKGGPRRRVFGLLRRCRQKKTRHEPLQVTVVGDIE